MALGGSLPQINLGVQGLTQGGHHNPDKILSRRISCPDGILCLHKKAPVVRPYDGDITRVLAMEQDMSTAAQ
ncbi:hypothetical protein TNCV_1006321 [Trichonephila clavipes]|nr:hypothetical protein TNCV_1006321 [Trichonephila clavipes]